jgi:uncharacterized protein YdeI (BOF family)
MRIFIYLLILLSASFLGGCSATKAINELALPPVSVIEGIVTQTDASGFTLKDHSGSIYVRAEMPNNEKLNVSIDEQLTVYGNLQGGIKKVFDGYVIRKASGEQIIVTNPTPHFGFILQTSFD